MDGSNEPEILSTVEWSNGRTGASSPWQEESTSGSSVGMSAAWIVQWLREVPPMDCGKKCRNCALTSVTRDWFGCSISALRRSSYYRFSCKKTCFSNQNRVDDPQRFWLSLFTANQTKSWEPKVERAFIFHCWQTLAFVAATVGSWLVSSCRHLHLPTILWTWTFPKIQ